MKTRTIAEVAAYFEGLELIRARDHPGRPVAPGGAGDEEHPYMYAAWRSSG